MAFKTLKTRHEVVSLAALGEEIAERRLALGPISVPRNVGTRRTRAKKALLEQIVKAGGNW